MNGALRLWLELTRLGVELDADGDRLRFHPRDRVTPELAGRMKDCKTDLLYLMTTTICCPYCRSVCLLDGPRGLWCLECERLAWIETDSGGAVRADVESQVVVNQ